MNERAPSGLKGSKKLWKQVVTEYELRPDELRLLEDACREADTIDALQEAASQADLLGTGSTGQTVIHPLIPEIRQHRIVLARILGSLRLPDDPTVAGSSASDKARTASLARWQRAHD